VIAWGLLLGFGTGAATMIMGGKIAWGWVGLTAVGGWLLSGIIALIVNGRTKQRNGN
jgi:hypothetical protein